MTKNNNILHAKSSSREREKLWVDSKDIRKLLKEIYDKKILLLLLFTTALLEQLGRLWIVFALSSLYARLTKTSGTGRLRNYKAFPKVGDCSFVVKICGQRNEL